MITASRHEFDAQRKEYEDRIQKAARNAADADMNLQDKMQSKKSRLELEKLKNTLLSLLIVKYQILKQKRKFIKLKQVL